MLEKTLYNQLFSRSFAPVEVNYWDGTKTIRRYGHLPKSKHQYP